MNFILLISCMHQHDKSILTKSNVQSDVVVVNQCDTDSVEEFDFVNKYGQTKHCIFVSTTQRGLSRSRNMAVSYAPEDSICKICDDDETFADDIETKVLCAYERHPDASLIAFSMNRPDKKYGKVYPKADMHLSFSRILKTTSVEITFKKRHISDFAITFDEKMGSGTGNGGGEENKFMLDIRRAGGKLYFAPENIGTVNPAPSQWFTGYNSDMIRNYGWAAHRSMGFLLGFIYSHYWVISHRHLYGNSLSMYGAYKNILGGFFEKR